MKTKIKTKQGFSLAEMLIVMLIVAVVAAVSAPLITRRANVYQNTEIFRPLGNDADSGVEYVAGKSQHIFLPKKNLPGTANSKGIGITYSEVNEIPAGSVLLGNTTFSNNTTNAVGIGFDLQNGSNSVAIGDSTQATGSNSTAIGAGAHATSDNATAIGAGATASSANTIVLGTSNDTVVIPGTLQLTNLSITGNLTVGGKLIVSGHTVLGSNSGARVFMRGITDNGSMTFFVGKSGDEYEQAACWPQYMWKDNTGLWGVTVPDKKWVETEYKNITSDKRLKNIGSKYTAGLEELKKLNFYHYTFKADKEKTPHVGVIAQDLQKVFPDAVKKGEDGYLRIRMEDMFYAVINAVKEINQKVTALFVKNDEVTKKISEMQATIDEQDALIKKQQEQIDKLVTRIGKLEKSTRKEK